MIEWLRRPASRMQGLRHKLSRSFLSVPDVNRMFARQTYHQLLTGVLGADGRYADQNGLGRHHVQVYSQNGEDGIIAEIFRRIGAEDRTFIEIGIGDGSENNTRFLLEQGWTGIWVEGSEEGVQAARKTFGTAVSSGSLRIVNGFVSAENVDAMLDEAGAPASVDLLCLDVDFNTPHIWQALRRRCRAACIEYNASLPPSADLVIPYDPRGIWDGTSWFGGSLKALERIGREKSMSLVGCDLLGVNAFFVRGDLAPGRFREPFTAENHYEPPRYDLTTKTGHGSSSGFRRWQSSPDVPDGSG